MNLWKIGCEWRQEHLDRHLRARGPVLEQVFQAVLEGRAADAARQWCRWMRWRWEYDCDAHVRVLLDRECGDTYDAEKVCRQRLWRTTSPNIRLQYMNYLVELALFHGRGDLMRESDAWTTELLRTRTATALISRWKACRGAVLVEIGRWDEALPYLHEVMEEEEFSTACAIAAHYLAKLHHDRGDLAMAREWLEVADAKRPCVHPGRLSVDLEPLREAGEK